MEPDLVRPQLLPSDVFKCSRCGHGLLEDTEEITSSPGKWDELFSTNVAPDDTQLHNIRLRLQQTRAGIERLNVLSESLEAALHPIRRLPDEILCKIFIFTLPSTTPATLSEAMASSSDTSQSPWTIAGVCQRWRRICLNYQPLWTSMSVNSDVAAWGQIALKLVGLQLLRSGVSRNLDVQIWWGSYLTEPDSVGRSIFNLLLLSSDRWSTLSVTTLGVKDLRDFFDHRHMNTSRLHKLDILCASMDFLRDHESAQQLVDFEDIRFPRHLKSLRIRAPTMFRVPQAKNLTHLVLRGPLNNAMQSRQTVPGETMSVNLMDLLKQTCATLRVCDIDCSRSVIWAWSPSIWETIVLPRLRILRFMECGKDFPPGILDRLTAPGLQELVVDDVRTNVAFEALSNFIRRSAILSRHSDGEEEPEDPQLLSLTVLSLAPPKSSAVEKAELHKLFKMLSSLQHLTLMHRGRGLKQIMQVLTLTGSDSSLPQDLSLLPSLHHLTINRLPDDSLLEYILRMVESRLNADGKVTPVKTVEFHDRLLLIPTNNSIKDRLTRCKDAEVKFPCVIPGPVEDTMNWEALYELEDD